MELQHKVESSILEVATLLSFASGARKSSAIEEIQRTCRASLLKTVTVLWQRVFQLIQSVREEMLSHDYRLSFISPAAQFTPATMTFQGRLPEGDHVALCTCGLGLERVTSTVTKLGPHFSEPNVTLLSKAEVHLEYLIDQIYGKLISGHRAGY